MKKNKFSIKVIEAGRLTDAETFHVNGGLATPIAGCSSFVCPSTFACPGTFFVRTCWNNHLFCGNGVYEYCTENGAFKNCGDYSIKK